MASDEKKSPDERSGQPKEGGYDQFVDDVSRLYAFANVEDAPYRDFFRQRKLHHTNQPLPDSGNPTVQAAKQEAGVVSSRAPEPVAAPKQAAAPVAESAKAAPAPKITPAEVFAPPAVAVAAEAKQAGITEGAAPPPGGKKPVIGIYSLAGGVGKTTICANFGRTFCSKGERVLLVNASDYELLPFYFGANDLRPGLRTFVPPEGKCLPLSVIGTDEVTPEWIENDVAAAMRTVDRVVFDLGPAALRLIPRVLGMCTQILIPLLPNPNSILSISRIESSLSKLRAAGIPVPPPYYVLNEFDPEHPRDARARELAGRQCGDRLLPMVIRYGTEVEDAVASRMTVTDHAPESEVARDFQELALWLKKIAPAVPERAVERRARRRWTEQ